VREVESLDNELESQKARNHATGQKGYRMPNTSRGLSDFAELNKIDLADDKSRVFLKEQMKVMKDKAPIIHMTFAVEADPESLKFLVEHIRKELHPQALLSVGLQPSLVGGVYMRTPNRVHDFSMRAKLSESRVVIRQDIEQLLQAVPVVEPPAAVMTPEAQS
jgi:hypothetical protein